MAHTDLRIIRSKKSIRRAFLTLIPQYGFQNITVQQIADEAFINRKTFYAYYPSKYDLYNEIADELIQILRPVVKRDPIAVQQSGTFSTVLQKTFEQITLNRELIKILIEDQSNPVFVNKLSELFREDLLYSVKNQKEPVGKLPVDLVERIYVSTIIEIVKWWVRQDAFPSSELASVYPMLFSDEVIRILNIPVL